jgi:serine/threonine-protein kinase RIO1
MERLAPETILTDLSLEAFMHVAVYELEIRSGGGDGGVCVVEGECVYAPAFFTAPTPLLEAWKAVSRFRARDVEIAPVEARRSVDAVQGRVRTAAGDMYFKPRVSMREDEFARELDILLHIDAAGLADRLRLPKLCGLVVSDGDKVIGLLMTMIGAGTTLRDLEMQGRTDMHGKWEGQVSEIVEMLHEHRIVWGDVHPMNVVIDDHMDAWAVDFGGRNNVDFVDDANRETIAGDWQGLRKIFKEWLVNPESRGRW